MNTILGHNQKNGASQTTFILRKSDTTFNLITVMMTKKKKFKI